MFTYLTGLLHRFQSKPVQTVLLAALVVLVLGIVLTSLVRWLRRRRQDNPESWVALVTGSLGTLLRVLVGLAVLVGLGLYLRFQSDEFARKQGGVSQRNYDAVRSIWGGPLVQSELGCRLATYVTRYYDKDNLELDVEKVKATTQPIGFRRAEVEEAVPGNPILEADHRLEVTMNYRKKGGASYPGFDTECRFSWRVRNLADKEVTGVFSFPLPSGQGLIDDLSVTADGKPVAEPVTVSGESLSWKIKLPPGKEFRLGIGYKSRGMDYVRLEPGGGRELRKYQARIICRGVDQRDINYPVGCMTPTERKQEGENVALTWNLDRAVTPLGMGVILPGEKQKSYYVSRILSEAPWALVLLMAMMIVTHVLTSRAVQWAPLLVMSLAFVLHHLLMGHIGEYKPGLYGGMAIAAAALTGLVAVLYLALAERFVAGAAVAFFAVFCLLYPLIRITEHEGLLLTILYVVLLAYVIVLMIRRPRPATA